MSTKFEQYHNVVCLFAASPLFLEDDIYSSKCLCQADGGVLSYQYSKTNNT